MPEWLSQLLIAGGGLGMLAALVKAWFAAWREDRIRRETTQQAIVDKLEARNEELREKVESLLMDAFARERETNTLRTERLAMDKQRMELDTKLAALGTALAVIVERSKEKDFA